MTLELNGMTALVTGGGSGLGAGIVEGLAAAGCKVAIADRDIAAAEHIAATYREKFPDVFPISMDVGDPDLVAKAVADTIRMSDRIDILVNCAGILKMGSVVESSAQDWDDISRINLAGVLHCIRAVAPEMARRGRGRIVNISSVSAVKGSGAFGNALYATTKAGVSALTMGLARELAPAGITVNAIAPGVADTPMTHAHISDEVRRKILARIPAGRFAVPADIANAVVFLASDRASYITGAIIPVDGGFLTT